MNQKYQQKLQIGHEFQDFVVEKFMMHLGISISIFQSTRYQFDKGENLQGIEIKYDSRCTGDCTYKQCSATNQIAIEIAEKTDKNNPKWIDSGIYRRDNSWLYIIGNYHQLWVFGKNHLKLMHQSGKYIERETLPTIKNMMLPIEDADKYCLKKIIF